MPRTINNDKALVIREETPPLMGLPDLSFENVEAINKKEKIELANLLHKKLINKCKSDPETFINYVGSHANKGWRNTCDMHVEWQDGLSNYDRVLIISPREHGKTTRMLLRMVWEIGKNPDIRIKLVCQSDDTAVKRVLAIISHIEKNPLIHEIFPDLRRSKNGVWSKTAMEVERPAVGLVDATLEAVGILSTATGGRADLLVFDDPVDFRNAIQQPSLRQTVKDVYMNVWMNILEDDGRVWYIATMWHKDDLTQNLIDSGIYKVLFYAIDDNYTPLWPSKWNKEALKRKRKEIGSRAYDRAFKNKALSDEDCLFPQHLFEKCQKDSDFEYGELPSNFNPKQTYYFFGIDIAAGKSLKVGAYSCVYIIAIQDKIKVPIKIIRGRYTSPQLTNLIIEANEEFQPEMIYVENNAQQEGLIQWITEIYGQSNFDLPPVEGFFTGMQKQDESIGLPSIAVEMESGTWKLPRPHEKDCKCNYCIWVNEMQEYPIGKYKDTVMACWFAKEAARGLTGRMPRIHIVTDDGEEIKTGNLTLTDKLIAEDFEEEDEFFNDIEEENELAELLETL